MRLNIDPARVSGLSDQARYELKKLLEVFHKNSSKNAIKERYYDGRIPLSEVNLGIALPEGMGKLEIGCAWGANAVDVLAARSMFDGFVTETGESLPELDALVRANRLLPEYRKATRDELKYGCDFATLSADPAIGCKIRFHSPATSAAVWDGDRGRIGYGMAIIDQAPSNNDSTEWQPSLINLYDDNFVWVLSRKGDLWSAQYYPHKMGRPLMEPLIWDSTSAKPFGQSRLKDRIRRMIQGYVRTVANASIGLEFATAPQKYLLGVTDDQYEILINQKFRQYVGSIIASTTNPDTGEKPTFGQLPQGNISPHVEMMRILSAQFAAATGLTVTDTGVVNDANPTSSDAILAQSQTLVAKAQELNAGNGDSLRTIALMALAISQDTTMEDLPEEQKSIVAHFKNPAMPNVAVTADAAIKIATARPGFADTNVFLEMLGFDQAEVRRINAQEQKARGLALIQEMEA